MKLPRISRIPYASLVLLALVLGSYAALTNFEPYASATAIDTYGLSFWNPFGVFTFLFIHQGLRHLLANLLQLAAFALLLETAMSASGVLVVFFASGIAGGLAFLFLNPGSIVIGASAASSGLAAASLALRPRQAFALAVIVALLAVFVVGPLAGAFAANREKQISALEASSAASNSSASLAGARRLAAEFAAGAAQDAAPVEWIPHAVGALVGLLIVIGFRRKEVDENIRGAKKWFGKRFSSGTVKN